MKETKHRNVVQLFPTERRKGNFKGTRDQSVKGARGWRADFAAGPAGGRRPQSRGRGREKSAAAHLELRNAWRHLYAPRMTQTFFKELNSLPLMRIPQGAPPPPPRGQHVCAAAGARAWAHVSECAYVRRRRLVALGTAASAPRGLRRQLPRHPGLGKRRVTLLRPAAFLAPGSQPFSVWWGSTYPGNPGDPLSLSAFFRSSEQTLPQGTCTIFLRW